MQRKISKFGNVMAAIGALAFGIAAASGQERGQATRNDAVLVVDGVVREVFRSVRQDRVDYLVQLDVKRVQADRVPSMSPRMGVPAPGDIVYVRTSQRSGIAQGHGIAGQSAPTGEVRPVVPGELSQVRAYLAPSARGGWEGAGSDWFETTSNVLAQANPGDPSPAAPESAPSALPPSRTEAPRTGAKSALAALGFTGEALNVKGQFVLRVSSVEQGGPAQRSGLEPGDVVIGANEKALGDLEQLSQLARQGVLKNLLVLDVNTGKVVRVPIEVPITKDAGAPAETPPVATSRPDPPTSPAPTGDTRPAGTSKSLGISAEPVMVGKRTGMKVIRVEPGSPAQKSGIEIGDVVVAANGVPVTGVEVLSAVLKKSGSSLTLTVRDTRTGRDVPVAVNVGGSEATPIPADTPVEAGSGRNLRRRHRTGVLRR